MSETEKNNPLYFDHHATTPCDPDVVSAMLPYFGDNFGNPHARHKNGRRAARALKQARAQIASLFNAAPESFILTSGATEANNLALCGQQPEDKRDTILISAIEHASVKNCIPTLHKNGFQIHSLPVTAQGFVTAETLTKTIDDRTKLVCVMAANHEIGTIQPIDDLCKIAHAHGALFHCDAAQAVGKIPFDLEKTPIDFLSFSAHKFYGPAGIGGLYRRTKPPIPLTPIIHGGGQQYGLRAGTVPLPLAIGLGAACNIAQARLAQDQAHLEKLTALFFQQCDTHNKTIHLNGGRENRLAGSLNITLPRDAAEDVLLDLHNYLCLSSGAACSSQSQTLSDTLKNIGCSDQDIDRSLRLSMGRATSEDDVKTCVEKLLPYL